MYAHTYIYIYILFTACGPLKHQRVMSGRRNQVYDYVICVGVYINTHVKHIK